MILSYFLDENTHTSKSSSFMDTLSECGLNMVGSTFKLHANQ